MSEFSQERSENAGSLARITPFILTYNEEPNIERCLDALQWASKIVVVDSGSTDRTLDLIALHPRAYVTQRTFDTHAGQANFALSLLTSPWALSLDADYILTARFIEVLKQEILDPNFVYFAKFRNYVGGLPLRHSLYPPRAVLFFRFQSAYIQDGHTQRLVLAGKTSRILPDVILHDDRKSRSRWRQNQHAYARLEAKKLCRVSHSELDLADQIRLFYWAAPLFIIPYILLMRGSLLDGKRGLIYAGERFYFEILLSALLARERSSRPKKCRYAFVLGWLLKLLNLC